MTGPIATRRPDGARRGRRQPGRSPGRLLAARLPLGAGHPASSVSAQTDRWGAGLAAVAGPCERRPVEVDAREPQRPRPRPAVALSGSWSPARGRLFTATRPPLPAHCRKVNPGVAPGPTSSSTQPLFEQRPAPSANRTGSRMWRPSLRVAGLIRSDPVPGDIREVWHPGTPEPYSRGGLREGARGRLHRRRMEPVRDRQAPRHDATVGQVSATRESRRLGYRRPCIASAR